MGGQTPVGVKPHFTRPEQQAGFAHVMHPLFLFGADFLFDPQEFPFAREIIQQFGFVEVGKNLCQASRCGHRVDH